MRGTILDTHYIDRIDWFQLCANSSPEAVQLIKERIEYEKQLILKEEPYTSKIDLNGLAFNEAPEAIELLIERIKDDMETKRRTRKHMHGNKALIIENLSKNPSIIVRYDKLMKSHHKTRHTRYLRDVDEITRKFSNIQTRIGKHTRLNSA